MVSHSVLMRQMRKQGVGPGAPPEGEAWNGFLERIDRFYKECDQDRYTLERSLAVCSDEMLTLNRQLQEALDQIQILNLKEREQAELRAAAERAGFQARLEHAQKMESLGNLAGGVAHDMNTVLAAILGIASANLEGQAEGSSVWKAFATIVKAAERGGKMVRGLLGYVRNAPEQMERVELNAIVEEETQLLARTALAHVSLVLDLQPDLRLVQGEAGALSHAIMNLCVNAVDAMAGQGTLTIRSRNLDDAWVELQIQDTGTGMPQAVLDRALEPFYTTKGPGKGTGLGLSMVVTTMKAHQGHLEIESEPGRGTRVKLRFPAAVGLAAEAGQVLAAGADAAMGALNVLLAEDDELVLEACIGILTTLGHRPWVAGTGEDALRLLEAGHPADLVLLDLNLPGPGGTSILASLRALRPDLPVVAVTGRADPGTLAMLEGFPRVTLLAKPFTLRQLQGHLEGLWRSRSCV